MDTRPVAAPDLTALAELAGELASTFVALSSDIALVVDRDGAVRQVVQGAAALTGDNGHSWVGRPWAETVTAESRAKVEQLLRDATAGQIGRAREVNLRVDDGTGVPVSMAAVRLGSEGPLLAVGRDLRAVSAIQQRFAETQRELERDYWKRREAESRYRLLFQVATDAVMVVDALTMNVLDANRAAVQLLRLGDDTLVGKHVSAGIEADSWPAVEELLNATRATGRAAEIHARLAGGGAIDISATPFRAERDLLLLVRARAVPARGNGSRAPWGDLVQRTPDAVVISDSSGRVQVANPAFLQLAELAGDDEAEGRELSRWIGADDGAVAALIARVKAHGMVAEAVAPLRGERGRAIEVGIAAALLEVGDGEGIGYTLRPLAGRAREALPAAEAIAGSIEALVTLIGRRPLPELLHAATALVERHLLASALQRCGGDAAQTSLLLGITPELLAQRLREHALQDAVATPRIN